MFGMLEISKKTFHNVSYIGYIGSWRVKIWKTMKNKNKILTFTISYWEKSIVGGLYKGGASCEPCNLLEWCPGVWVGGTKVFVG